MFTQLTKPTTITQEQYDNATFAINRETAEHWLIYNDCNGNQQCLFVGADESSLSVSEREIYTGELNAQVEAVDVIGTSGEDVEIEAIVFDVSESGAALDLDALAEGTIEWM